MRGLAVLAMLAGVFIGDVAFAQRTVIIDEPTPSGEVAPAKPVAPTQPYRPQGRDVRERATQSGSESISCVEFEKVYKKAKSPGIVLFLNRTVSDNIREWESSTRIHYSYQSERTTTKNGSKAASTSRGEANGSVQRKAADGSRGHLDEAYLWRLEESLVGPLVQCGVTVVDRAQVVRLAAADEGAIGQENTSAKYIEIQALRGYSDLVAQVECGHTSEGGGQQLFRMKVVDVRSGRILVTRTVQGKDFGWVATDGGYERSAEPAPESVGVALAQALLDGLGRALGR